MLSHHIKQIKKELSKYYTETDESTIKERKQELLTSCINSKLDATLDKYNREIDLNSDYLLTRSSFRVLKALTKLQKRADKAVIEAAKHEGEPNE